MMMKRILLAWAFFALVTSAYSQNRAITFVESNNWNEVLARAKKENKPVFVDFYTTWCAPCREMDSQVYSDQAVAEYFNSKFISVKIQMDRTKSDSKHIQDWYPDAKLLEKRYSITAYPTLIFVSPDGRLLNRGIGFHKPELFVQLAKSVIDSGERYVDRQGVFFQELSKYRINKSGPEMLGKLIEEAKSIKLFKIADTLSKEYLEVLGKLAPQELFTKKRLEFIGYSRLHAKDPLMKIFYQNEKKVDLVVQITGFSKGVIDRAIGRDYFENSLKSAKIASALNWDSLFNLVRSAFGKTYAERSIAIAKVRSYEVQRLPEFTNAYIEMVDRYGPESTLVYGNMGILPSEEHQMAMDLSLNAFSWINIFSRSFDRKQLSKGLKWMEDISQRAGKGENYFWAFLTLDTYANLLYKSGQTDKALLRQSEALEFAKKAKDASKKDIANCEKTIEKMKAGTPTWPVPKKI